MKTTGDEKQASGTITHVFVLIMENGSFDHMLGFAGLSGTDAATGKSTRADDLVDNPHSNVDPNEPGTQVPAASPAELKLYPPDLTPVTNSLTSSCSWAVPMPVTPIPPRRSILQ